MLTVHKLTKYYGSHRVIDSLTLSIEQGNRVTLFAPSGSGKTTLINILNGFDREFEGTYRLAARNPATVFQEPRLFAHLTVRENIFLPLSVHKTPITRQIEEQYQAWLAVCDLEAQTEQYPFQLSGGMKQKVSLIRSFMIDPDFILLDEPFKSIDLGSKKRIICHILDHYPSLTLLLATHDLEEIPLLTKWLLVFKSNTLNGYSVIRDLSKFQLPDLFSNLEPPH